MQAGLEPTFAAGRPTWPLAGMHAHGYEPDDPDLEIPLGALESSVREAPEPQFQPHDDGTVTSAADEPLAPNRVAPHGRKTTLSILASFLVHAAIAAAFLYVAGEEVLIEGADFTGVAILGEGADQVKAGEISDLEDNAVEVTIATMLEANPVETVEPVAAPVEETGEALESAEAVTEQPESLQPVTEAPAQQVIERTAEPVAAPHQQVTPAEPQQPVQVQQPQPAPAEPAESVPIPTVTETVPEVLTTDRADKVDDDNVVQKPAEVLATEPVQVGDAIQAQPTETTSATQEEAPSLAATQPAETEAIEAAAPSSEPVYAAQSQSAEAVHAEQSQAPTAEPGESSPVETTDVALAEPAEAQAVEAEVIDTPDEAPRPEPKPPQVAEQKPAGQPAERMAAKQDQPHEAPKKEATRKAAEGKKIAETAEPRQTRSGNGGQNRSNARRGQTDGQENGDSRQASRGGSKKGQVGNAAVSNYPGKVRSKLARAARSIRARGSGEVIVAFAVGSNGGVRSARVTRSSGVASVDQAALQAVRKASPFPPIPANAGRAKWDFSIPLAFRR
jgi:protein TonB